MGRTSWSSLKKDSIKQFISNLAGTKKEEIVIETIPLSLAIEFAKWIGGKRLTYQKINDRWYDFYSMYVGNTEEVWEEFKQNKPELF